MSPITIIIFASLIPNHMSKEVPISSLLDLVNEKKKCDVCVANQDYCNPNWLPYNNLNAGLRHGDLSFPLAYNDSQTLLLQASLIG